MSYCFIPTFDFCKIKFFHSKYFIFWFVSSFYNFNFESFTCFIDQLSSNFYITRIVLATGNKSELSVGYTTLYGDLVGGLAVIGDVLKRDVYALARASNRDGPRVPVNTIDKPPSAELAPDQPDSDSLPEYPVLDQVLEQAIERGVAGADIRAPEGAGEDTVRWVLRALDRNEYKRRQAPLVLRVSGKAFGTGRRLPIVHRSGWGV